MPNSLYNKHVISISELNRDDLELILNTAQKLKAEPRTDLLKNKIIASCFFEASTRTRLSFETAIQRLGGRVIGFSDASNTSMIKKGETFADSIRIITGYADALECVLDERRRELCYEGHRMFDVFRNNLPMDRRFVGCHDWEILQPNDPRIALLLPLDEINASGIPQNKR